MRHKRLKPVGAICAMGAAGLGLLGCQGAGSIWEFRGQPKKAERPAARWQLPQAFGLSRAVPADVCLYLHWVRNPERDALRPHYKRFWKQVRTAEPDKELLRLLLPAQSGEGRKRFERTWRRAVDRFDAIDFDSLTREEVVVLGRMNGLAPEVILLCRDDPKTVEHNAKVMRELFEALAELGEDSQVIPLDVHDTETIILASAREAQCLQMARRGDLIALCYGPRPPELMDDVLGLVTGKSAKRRLVDSSRFKTIMTPLPAPEDDLALLDVRLAVQQMLRTEAGSAGSPGPTSRPTGLARAARGLIRLLDIYDTHASVGWTNESRQHHQSITALAANCEQKALYPAVCKQRGFESFDRFIPARADAYWLWGGANPAALYDAVLNALRAQADDPDRFMTEWTTAQQQIGLSFKRDLLEWLDGRAMLISLPSASASAKDPDLVLMLGVQDASRARAKIAELVARLRALSARWEQPITTRPAAFQGERFHQLLLHGAGPASPVLGVADGWVVLATSSAAAERCLATAGGESPSMRTNPRLKAEGIVPDGSVSAASFVELDRLGPRLSRWFGLIGLIEQYLPDRPETETVKAAFSLLDRLSVPIRALDFYASSSSVTRFDGGAWRTQAVTTYKLPARKP